MKKIISTPPKKSKIIAAISCFTLCMFLSFSVLNAQPDFTGSWKLNASLSTQNAEMSMAPKTLKIQHDADSLIVEKMFDMMGQTANINEKHSLDGNNCTNKWIMDSQSTSRAMWNDQKLSLWVYSSMDIQGATLTSSEAYYKDDAGHLVILFNIEIPTMGAFAETYVYDKE